MIFHVTPDGRFRYVNQRALDVLGYERGELMTLHTTDVLVGYDKQDRELLHDRITRRPGLYVRVTVRRKDGQTLTTASVNESVVVEGQTVTVCYAWPVGADGGASLPGPTASATPLRRSDLYLAADELGIVGSSRELTEVLHRALHFAATDRPLLILGETGVGKESLARLVHRLSKRRNKPFEIINCGAINDDLAGSQLFGHVRGAFTGASSDRAGLLARAEGGTVFLDEVGELSPRVQIALLRVLQNKEYSPVGSEEVKTTNVRIVAATNRNLPEMIAQKQFRRDLYHRINVLALHLPPLRKRVGDLPQLLRYRLDELNATEGLNRTLPKGDCLIRLEAYPFPGNIRELFAVIDRACFNGFDGPLAFRLGELPEDCLPVATEDDELLTMEELQRRHIRRVLRACGGKVSGAGGVAEVLGMKRGTLLGLMGRLGL